MKYIGIEKHGKKFRFKIQCNNQTYVSSVFSSKKEAWLAKLYKSRELKKESLDKRREAIILLKRGDQSFTQIANLINMSTSYVSYIAREYHIRSVYNNYRRSVNDYYFNNMNTSTKWYILGLLFADGYIDECSKNSRVGLGLVDKQLIKSVRDKIRFTGSITTRTPVPGKKQYILRISSKQMVSDLKALGCVPRKTLNPVVPKVPDKYFHHFLRGLFDGDGCITYSKSSGQAIVRLDGSDKIMLWIKDELQDRLDIGASFSQTSMNGYGLQFGGNRQVRRFRLWLYRGHTICLDRKRQRFLKLGV